MFFEGHIDEIPAPEGCSVAFAMFLKPFYIIDDIQGLPPCPEHFSVRESFDLLFRDLCQCGEKRLAQRRPALRGTLNACVPGASDKLIVVTRRRPSYYRRGYLFFTEALGNQPVLIHLHENAARRVNDRDLFGPQRRLLKRILHVQVYYVGHVFKGLAGARLAAIIHFRFFDGPVFGKAGELHVLAAYFEDGVDIGVVMLYAEGVTGNLVRYSVDGR